MAPQPYLIRTKTNEKIILSGETFRIGKEEGYVNYCVKDNPTISRSHAVIRKDDNGYTIVDTNSTNHTYVDGKMTTGSAGAQLTHGVRIRLSDEEFVFYKS
ncbi:MAG: FHA domain-containing protein [Coriobacteriales bacterium]|nr:FHA domain-containing protein [Coriobacteriales bacterium]